MTITPIGHIQTPYTQKFGIPRQAAGLSVAKGSIFFAEHINPIEACEGILQFSHLWIIFQFHENISKGWSAKVRPPRLGGNAKTGVFATRSSFRPNGLGMSLVKVIGFEDQQLLVEGVDMLSGTPIYDIKPYIAYSDSVGNAISGYASTPPDFPLSLVYTESAQEELAKLSKMYPDLSSLVENTICADPRPAYKKNQEDLKQYHIRLYDIDIAFSIRNQCAKISSLSLIKCK